MLERVTKRTARLIDSKDFRTATAAGLSVALIVALASVFIPDVRATLLAVLGWLWNTAIRSVPVPGWLLGFLIAATLMLIGREAFKILRRSQAFESQVRLEDLTEIQFNIAHNLAHHAEGWHRSELARISHSRRTACNTN